MIGVLTIFSSITAKTPITNENNLGHIFFFKGTFVILLQHDVSFWDIFLYLSTTEVYEYLKTSLEFEFNSFPSRDFSLSQTSSRGNLWEGADDAFGTSSALRSSNQDRKSRFPLPIQRTSLGCGNRIPGSSHSVRMFSLPGQP